jgi:rare lipoprotein A
MTVKINHLLLKAVVFSLMLSLTSTAHAQSAKKTRLSSGGKNSNKILYGQASFYANKFNGRRTASGEIFSQAKLTAACNVLPLGTWIQVTNLKNGKIVVVKINDRLHPSMRRLIDLTRTGAKQLEYISRGLTRVKVEVLDQKLYK